MTAPVTTCPACSAQASGRFCANCGAPLAGAACAECGTSLTPGARFCHRCGTPAGAAARREGATAGTALPWAVAGIVFLIFVAFVAGQRIGASRGGAAAAGIAGAPTGDEAPPARAPDISSLSPEERADRLFDRMMRLDEQGKRDSVEMFAPMAVAAYQMLGSLDPDRRYDLGRIGTVAGAPELARAQADTILREHPAHLLGLALAMRAARLTGDRRAAREFARRLIAAAPAERAKNLPEYQRHAGDIAGAIEEAKGY
jgi:hypothetical protein